MEIEKYTGCVYKFDIFFLPVLFLLNGCGQSTGKNYYECLFVVSAQGNQKNGIATEICNQLHPPFLAKPEESALLEFEAWSSAGTYKRIKIHNKNNNFIVTELTATFEGKEKRVDIRYYAQISPLSIGWTETVQTGVEGDFKFYISSVKGRPFK